MSKSQRNIFCKLIRHDHRKAFTELLMSQHEQASVNDAIIWLSICEHRAEGCLYQLLASERDQLYVPLEGGLYPLHIAAQTLWSLATDAFLSRRARTDVPSHDPANFPLCVALNSLRYNTCASEWKPKISIFKLLYILCLPELKEPLETVKLLAAETEQLEKISSHFVLQGEVVQFAALLLVAWDKLVQPFSDQGIKGSPIGQLIQNQLQYHHENHVSQNCNSSDETNEHGANLENAWKLLQILDIARNTIEECRLSELSEDIQPHLVPVHVAHKLWDKHQIYLEPEDRFADDVKWPQLTPKQKAWLSQSIDKGNRSLSTPPTLTVRRTTGRAWSSHSYHTLSPSSNLVKPCKSQLNNFAPIMSSFQLSSFIDEPVFLLNASRRLCYSSEYPTFKAVRRNSRELSFEDHLHLAFVWDDKDEFVNATKGLPPDQNLFSELFDSMYSHDAVNCVSALINPDSCHHFNFDLMDTAMGKVQDRDPDSVDICTTPLHQAAHFVSVNITRLLVDLGDSPNTRIDFFYTIHESMKDALPLNVVLDLPRNYRSMEEWTKKKSIFKLITILCSRCMMKRIEVARLLALKTKDLEQEFFRYMMDGKLAEMCILLLAGCRLPSASMLQCRDNIPEKEKILELLEVFDTIGDKLSRYIRLKRSKLVEPDRKVSEIASLFEDSGFIVKSEDIPSRYNLISPWDYPTKPPFDSKMISVPRLFSPHVLGGSSFTNKGLSLNHGVRLFHNSSVPKVVQNQAKNKVIGDLTVQLCNHRAIFTTALRRVGRLV